MIDFDALAVNTNDTALLIIDIQEKLAPAIVDQESIIAKTAALVQIASAMELPILVTEQYPRGLGATVPALRELLDQAPSVCGKFEKMAFSACTSEVMDALKATGRRKVIITGMETHVCVFQTVRALQADGFQCFLARDAVGSRTMANRDNGFDLIKACGGVISNVETLLFDLLQEAGTPLFKQLSKLIK